VTTVQELEVTVTSHIDVCAVRYEAIHARLKRLEGLVAEGRRGHHHHFADRTR
jgi:hypothetical protein